MIFTTGAIFAGIAFVFAIRTFFVNAVFNFELPAPLND